MVIAINNRIELYQFNLRLGDNIDLIIKETKIAGTFL